MTETIEDAAPLLGCHHLNPLSVQSPTCQDTIQLSRNNSDSTASTRHHLESGHGQLILVASISVTPPTNQTITYTIDAPAQGSCHCLLTPQGGIINNKQPLLEDQACRRWRPKTTRRQMTLERHFRTLGVRRSWFSGRGVLGCCDPAQWCDEAANA